jgi:hypothetical protein
MFVSGTALAMKRVMPLPIFWLPSALAAALSVAAPASPAAPSPSLVTSRPATVEAASKRAVLVDASGPRAQRAVAEWLVDAETIDLASSAPGRLRFALERAGKPYHLDVALDRGGRIERASLAPAPRREVGDGVLSWLGMAIGDHEQVIAASVAADGVVTLQLDDGTTVPLTADAGDDYVGC